MPDARDIELAGQKMADYEIAEETSYRNLVQSRRN